MSNGSEGKDKGESQRPLTEGTRETFKKDVTIRDNSQKPSPPPPPSDKGTKK